MAHDTIYVGSDDGVLYALDAAGEEQWRFETDDAVRSSPAVVDGTAYIGSNDGHVYAVDGRSGEARWSEELNREVFSSPTVVDNTVFVGSRGAENEGAVSALNAGSGNEDWRFETDEVWSSPAVVDDTVYVGNNDGHVYAQARSGDEQWQFETEDTVRSSPVVVEDTVYVGSDDGYLYALDAASGDEQGRFETGTPVVGSPAIADDTIYVGSGSASVGHAYAISDGDVRTELTSWIDWIPVPNDAPQDDIGVAYRGFDDLRDVIEITQNVSRDDIDFGEYHTAASPYNFVTPEAERDFIQVRYGDDIAFEVIRGSFGSEEVELHLDRDQLGQEQYNSFTLYSDGDTVIGVGDGTIVIPGTRGNTSTEMTETARSVIDAGTGDEQRFHEAHEHFADLMGQAGDAAVLRVGSSETTSADGSGLASDLLGFASSFLVEGSVVQRQIIVLFIDESAVDSEVVTEMFDVGEEASYREDGRAGIVETSEELDDEHISAGIAQIGFHSCPLLREPARVTFGFSC